MAPDNDITSMWDPIETGEGDCLHWRVGPLGLWVRRTAAEWQVAEEHHEDVEMMAATPDAAPPDGLEWTRWASGPETPPVRVRPVTPDRPVVVRPEQAFRILPRATAKVYISLPLWIRVEIVPADRPVTLIDIPIVRLSNTWFGTLFEGKLCYWTGTTARRSVDARDPAPHIATAPMEIVNGAVEELPLEKVCLNTENLSVYQGARRLWTSAVRVTSTGATRPQKIEVLDGPPADAPETRLVSEPRHRARGGILASTIGLLQSLPGASQIMEE